jgi:hypothetical protein
MIRARQLNRATPLLEGVLSRVTRAKAEHRKEGSGGAGYFSLATTNSGAHNNARLISESGNVQMALRADSA